ncbi:MAG: ATP-binding protein [Eubacteriales bacterium]|nr:ATP-binding protein [Eubacteriales bacterium]
MSDRVYRDILDEQAARRAAREQAAAGRYHELLAQDAALREAARTVRHAALTGEGEQTAREAWEALCARALAARGWSADALNPAPECPLCGDRGYVQGRLCACVRNAAAQRLLGGSRVRGFADFDETVYPEAPIPPGVTQRAYMARLRGMMEQYCLDYPQSRENYVFTGKAGLGKTYLMECMGAELMKRGASVARVTAFQVNAMMARALRGEDSMGVLMDSDVLLLDDMGSEPLLNKVTIAGFFNLFNERSIAGRPVITTTNLTPAEIQERYGDRVFSRMLDKRTTRVIPFYGADVRNARG